ncbi:MAG: hypothetical protein LBN27_12435, partial [Prevotellaceae bacterium]|nr:hypothetical protein [Prevotellaceae bacterium]
MKRITTILLCLVLFLPCAAQLTFNYDNITICEGDTYDLLNYQTNEVIVPVGWEIIGWQGVANTTVKPAASPTVYTLEYREIANQAQIYTKDLSVYMRPKPQAILYGLVKNYVCVGETITLSGDGKNYDRLLWYCEEIGETYEGKDWETVVPDNYNNLYYRFYATNNECATKSEGVYYLDVIRPDANYEIAVNIAGGIYINENVISVPYCGKSFYLSDYVSFNSLQGLPYYDYSARIIISAPRAVWESPDIYTEGALLFLNDIGEYYENTVRYEVDLYFPDCDVHRTIVSEPMSINFYTNCTPGIAPLYFDCDERSGIGTISMSTYQNVDSILSFDFINQTTPGKYIPEGTPINNEYGQHFIRYNVTFDENVPAKLTYSATMIYRRSDGQILTYSYPNFQINTCKKEKIVEYVIGTGYATQSNGTPLCSPVTYLQCWTKNDGSPTMVRQNFCKGTSTQLTLRSNTETPWTIIFDNEEKLPTPSGATYAYVDGKHTYEFTPISTDKITFSVSPDKTTVYTGTLDGVAFAFTLNLVNYSLVSAEDTIICSGQSIDLKGLENSENIAGAVTWNITNTVVTPLVDTEYLIFGLSKNACPGTYNLQRTDRVRVMVDKPLWATQKNLLVACVNDTISLNKGINTNVRQYEWR